MKTPHPDTVKRIGSINRMREQDKRKAQEAQIEQNTHDIYLVKKKLGMFKSRRKIESNTIEESAAPFVPFAAIQENMPTIIGGIGYFSFMILMGWIMFRKCD